MKDLSNQFRDFLSKCLEINHSIFIDFKFTYFLLKNPNFNLARRPNAEDLLKHNIFKDLKID